MQQFPRREFPHVDVPGSIARHKGDLKLALAIFQQAERQKIDFRMPEIHNNLAAILRDQGQFAPAYRATQ